MFICKNKEKISALLGIFVKFIEQRLDVLGAIAIVSIYACKEIAHIACHCAVFNKCPEILNGVD